MSTIERGGDKAPKTRETDAKPAQNPAEAPQKGDARYSQSISELIGTGLSRGYKEGVDDEYREEVGAYFLDVASTMQRLGTLKGIKDLDKYPDIKEDYADGLALLLAKEASRIELETGRIENMDEQVAKEQKPLDDKNKRLTSETLAKLFPDIKAPANSNDLNTQINNLISTPDAVPIQFVGHLENLSGASTTPELLKRLDTLMIYIGDSANSNIHIEPKFHGDDLGVKDKKGVLKMARLYRQLDLCKQEITREHYGNKEISAEDMKKIDAVRDGLGNPDKQPHWFPSEIPLPPEAKKADEFIKGMLEYEEGKLNNPESEKSFMPTTRMLLTSIEMVFRKLKTPLPVGESKKFLPRLLLAINEERNALLPEMMKKATKGKEFETESKATSDAVEAVLGRLKGLKEEFKTVNDSDDERRAKLNPGMQISMKLDLSYVVRTLFSNYLKKR
jgi:hypothetical protein